MRFATLLRSSLTRLSKVDWFVVGRRAGNLTIVRLYYPPQLRRYDWEFYLRFIANALILPWGILRTKMWDIAGLVSFLMAIELHKLITILFFSMIFIFHTVLAIGILVGLVFDGINREFIRRTETSRRDDLIRRGYIL